MRHTLPIHLTRMLLGFSLLVPMIQAGCGTENVFELLEEPDSKKKGESALSRGDYDEAISQLESALRSNPRDLQTRKMLANAYMAKSRVDTLKILQTIASRKEASDWGVLVAAMPDGTPENQQNLARAVRILEVIPLESRTQEERYQMAMAQTSLAVVTAKKYGIDEGGEVPLENVSKVTDEDADLIVENLAGAGQNLTGIGDSSSQSASTKINNVVTELNASEGASAGQKVRNFLSSGSR